MFDTIKFIKLKGYYLASFKDAPDDWEIFNEIVEVNFEIKGEDKISTYQLNAVSSAWLEQNHDTYIQYGITMKYFDKKIIGDELIKIIKLCNSETRILRALDCLNHHMQYKNSEPLYES